MPKVRWLALLFVLALCGAWLVAHGTGRADEPASDEPTVDKSAADDTPAAEVALSERPRATLVDAHRLAKMVSIYRDPYGVPHVDGQTDESTVFGFAYAQAEDFFWQIEDSYILALGRYSEVYGGRGLNSDLLNRAFEVTRRSIEEYKQLDPELQSLCRAYVAGLNYYLDTHPEVKPRLIKRFEPWQVLAYQYHLTIELCYRYTRLSDNYLPRQNKRIWAATGSNGWAISGSRTQSGGTMLMANPHLPWYGFGLMYEAHLRSDQGLDFSGATFYGSPLLHIGHNANLGWTMTVNEPDVADAWRVVFDDPSDPLNYRYDRGYRHATEWDEEIRISTPSGMQQRTFKMRKTHQGPVVEKVDDQTYLVAQLAPLKYGMRVGQTLAMAKSANLDEFRQALAMQQLPIMNLLYADRDGNIFYIYNGMIPRRDPKFDWSKPVDGSNPRTEWGELHTIDELPQVLNPPAGFVQNCNSTPFTTTDEAGNPAPDAFPPYMIEDKNDDRRRAKRSRELLRAMHGVSFDEVQVAALDTQLYWAKHEIPKFAEHLKSLQQTDPRLAAQVEPLLAHLLDWDCRVTLDSTQAALCEAWYETLYGSDYPGEKLKPAYEGKPEKQLEALVTAAASLRRMHGNWQVPYGDIHRVQRLPYVADLLQVPFDDDLFSLPTPGAHGPMGVMFTQYYTPSIYIPLVMTQRKRYAVVGTTYAGVYEFAPDGVRSVSVVPYGASGNPDSPHYTDQAKLLAASSFKPALFDWDEIKSEAVRAYHPGD